MNTRVLREWLGLVPGMQKAGNGAHMPVVSMLLYAHAAAGPEYEYPGVSASDQLRMPANRVRRPTAQ